MKEITDFQLAVLVIMCVVLVSAILVFYYKVIKLVVEVMKRFFGEL